MSSRKTTPEFSAYGTEWYQYKIGCAKYALSRGHTYFVIRYDGDWECRQCDYAIGSFQDEASYHDAVEHIDKDNLETYWRSIDLTKEIRSLEEDKRRKASKAKAKETVELKADEVVKKEAKGEDLPPSKELSELRVLEAEQPTIPSSKILLIKMICHRERGILDYLVASRRGSLVFTSIPQGSDDIQGYSYDDQSGMWNVGSELALKSIILKSLLTLLNECKQHLLSSDVVDDNINKSKYLKKLKEQKELLAALIHYHRIWKAFTHELFQATFKDRLDKNTAWCPLNDGMCLHLKSGSIRKIEPTDYFTRYLNVNSSGESVHPRCQQLFENTANKRKNYSFLFGDMNEILNVSEAPTQPPQRPDVLADFLKRCLVRTDPLMNSSVLFKDLYGHYESHCIQHQVNVVSKKKFALKVNSCGYLKEKRGNTVIILDVKFSEKYTSPTTPQQQQ